MTEANLVNPFSLLVDMAESCRESAVVLPDQQVLEGEWRGIGFRLGGQTFVAPMLEVDEILMPPSYTKVPGVKTWLKGVANVRGRLLSVVDLGAMLGKVQCAATPESRVMAIKTGDVYSGVIVDEVLGMQTFANTDSSSNCDVNDEALDPFVNGGFEKDGQQWPVFSLFKLAQAPEFMNVSA